MSGSGPVPLIRRRQNTQELWVGNDVVDLLDPGSVGKSSDSRYITRILDDREQRRILENPSDRHLWSLWSAKEAAFKLVSKWTGKRVPLRSLHVECAPDLHTARGSVRCEQLRIAVTWQQTADYVHCLARPEPEVPTEGVWPEAEMHWAVVPIAGEWATARSLTQRERRGGRRRGSATARAVAKELLWQASRSETAATRPRVEIVRERLEPPRWLLDGQPWQESDVSLSHHGRYAAAAVTTRLPDAPAGRCA